MTYRFVAARLAPVLAVGILIAGCSSGESATSPSTSTAAAPTASAAGPAPAGAPTAAACGEINRLTREELDGLADNSPEHWESFAIALQSVANVADDPEFRTALTDLATAALTASESLAAGEKAGAATAPFRDAIPTVDSLCKKAGTPLI